MVLDLSGLPLMAYGALALLAAVRHVAADPSGTRVSGAEPTGGDDGARRPPAGGVPGGPEADRDALLERLNLQFERLPIPCLVTGPDFTIREWNPAAERVFGFTRDEAVGRAPYGLIVRESLRPLLEPFLTEVAKADRTIEVAVNENLTKDGRVIECEWHHTPLRDPRGALIGFMAVVQDVTDRNRNERQLRQLSRAVEQSPASIIVTDTEGRIEYVNPMFTEVSGYTREESVGRNPRFLKSGLVAPEEYAALWRTIKAGRTWQGFLQNRKKNGALYWEKVTIAPIRDNANRITHYVAVKEDLAERQRAEAQLDAARRELAQAQKLETVGRLAGGIAHDYNNLLTTVLGYTGFLLERHLPGDPERDDLEEILRAGERAAHLTEQLLAFGRQQILAPRLVDVNVAVAGAARLLGTLLGPGIDLVTHQAGELGLVVADPGCLDQILMNLAANARDAMPGGGRLTIETGNVDITADDEPAHPGVPPGAYVCLSLSDTGKGMSAEVRARVFEPFFTTKALGRGTGLGLSTVYGIVKQSGGHVEVDSVEGDGTTFRVYLPRVPRDHAGAVAAAPPAAI